MWRIIEPLISAKRHAWYEEDERIERYLQWLEKAHAHVTKVLANG